MFVRSLLQRPTVQRVTVQPVSRQWRSFAGSSVVKSTGGDVGTATLNPAFSALPASIARAWASRSAADLVAAPATPLASVSDAYAVQRLASQIIHTELKVPFAGYKIGATSREVQKKFGTNECFAAPIFESRLHRNCFDAGSAYRYAWDSFAETIRGVECEFAVRFKRYAPVATTLTGKPEYELARASIVAIIPTIEMASSRWKTGFPNSAPLAIGDLGTSAQIICGKEITEPARIAAILDAFDNARAAPAVSLRVNGTVAVTGNSTAVMGNPLNAITWLNRWLASHDANHRKAPNGGGWYSSPEGAVQFVSTGTCTGVTAVSRGDSVYADFGPEVGHVHAQF